MAIQDDRIFYQTNALISAKGQRHILTSVSPTHWQLRSLLGSDDANFLYYPTGRENKEVKRLDAATGEAETIRRLPFEPRCLVAQKGWVCCGGETGEFAAFQTAEAQKGSSATNSQIPDLDNDDGILALALWAAPPSAAKPMTVKSRICSDQRVNCITMWFPPPVGRRCTGAYTHPVAVLAQNDRTVVILNLHDQETLSTTHYPDLVNRAVISPDGRLLAAICDDPFLYIHERVERVETPPGTPLVMSELAYEWKRGPKIHLKSQNIRDKTNSRGSFALCFSGSGRYLAVATQYGCISLFDVARLTEPGLDPLMTTWWSSRTGQFAAVRDMAFAPGCIDLLAWTEDRGRVGIADLRTGCVARQILDLERDQDHEQIRIIDKATRRPDRTDLEQASSDTHRYLNTFDQPQEFTTEETRVLEALRDGRLERFERLRRELMGTRDRVTTEARLSASPPWFDTAGRSPELTARRTTAHSANPLGVDDAARNLEVLSSMRGQREREVLSSMREQREQLRETEERVRTSLRDVRRETEGPTRGLTRHTGPSITSGSGPGSTVNLIRARISARPASVNVLELLSELNSSSRSSSSSTGLSNGNGSGNDQTNANPRASQRATGTLGLYNWPEIESSFRLAADSGGSGSSGSSTATIERAIEQMHTRTLSSGLLGTSAAEVRQRARAAYVARGGQPPWGEIPTTASAAQVARENEWHPETHDIAGLVWSDRGDQLFVAAYNGIFCFQVDMLGRKVLPGLEYR